MHLVTSGRVNITANTHAVAAKTPFARGQLLRRAPGSSPQTSDGRWQLPAVAGPSPRAPTRRRAVLRMPKPYISLKRTFLYHSAQCGKPLVVHAKKVAGSEADFGVLPSHGRTA